MSFTIKNDDSLLAQDENLSNDIIKKPNSILKKPKNKKQKSNDSDSTISTVKKKLLNESSIDMLNDNTLDGFSIDENTVDIIDDEEMSQECSQNVVTFNLNDNNTNTQQEASGSSTSQSQSITSVKKRKRRCSAFYVDQSIASKISVSQLFVYKWPQDEPGNELFILQEQVSDYLEIKSFKRKYPYIYRRPIELNEREYLKENKIVSETQCDLGLTALKLDEVLLIMSLEYADQYKEFNNLLNEKRKALAVTQIQKRKSETIKTNKPLDKTKIKEITKKAIKSAAEYNSQLQKEKKEERKLFFDMHTMRIQVPRTRELKINNEPISLPYPVSLIDGQYQHYYKKYTSDELKYLPLNTILYPCPKPTPLMYWEWKHDSHSHAENQNSSDEKDEFEENSNINNGSSALASILNNNNKIIESNVKTPKVEPPTIATCYVCKKNASSDQMIHCSLCPRYSHPNCLELNPSLVNWNCIRNYNWQCMECKICSSCNEDHDEDKMMFCDRCDRGFHTYCVGVKIVPSGSWLCVTCKSNKTLNISSKSTPVKMKINNILSNDGGGGGSISLSPAKRGRPIGSLNKPKIPQQIKDNNLNKSLIKEGLIKNSSFLLRDLFDSTTADSPTSTADTSIRKSRGRPKKTSFDNSTNYINTAGYSNTNSKDDEFIMDQDDDYSLNSYNYTNTCVIDDNISNQFYAFNS